jgi:hypothetical protein
MRRFAAYFVLMAAMFTGCAASWFTSKTMDLGFDFEAWNGLLGISYDYYERYREGMFARKSGSLPTVVGATAPRENLDSDKHMQPVQAGQL